MRLKNVKLSELFPNASAAAGVASERIFINENLTAFRRRSVKMATDKKKDGLLLGVWTIDGKVFVKTSPDGSPISQILITFNSMLTTAGRWKHNETLTAVTNNTRPIAFKRVEPKLRFGGRQSKKSRWNYF